MKALKSLISVIVLLFVCKLNAQTCTASFVYSLNPNGTVTFSNTTIPANPTVTNVYIWNTGNGMTYTTNSISQTVSTTYTSNGVYVVFITEQNCGGFSFQNISYTVQGCPLLADMIGTNTAPYSPTVNFTSLSTGTTQNTTYNWSFGDGTFGSGPNPTHIYTANGGFNYTLVATENATCSSFIASFYSDPSTPTAVIVCGYTPSLIYSQGANGLLNFTTTATGPTWYVNWDFGLGVSPVPSMSSTISNIYFNGVYTPTVILFTYFGYCPTFTCGASVTVTDNPCDANAAFTYTPGNAGNVQFSKILPPVNPNIAYSWYFGDGVSSNQVNPSHTYASAGTYTVILISYDIASPPFNVLDTAIIPCRTFSTVGLNITGIPCIANPDFTLIPASIPQTCYINVFYPYNYTSVDWSWGDGSNSNVLYANHTYSLAGNYNICLTVTTSCGAISNTCVSQYVSKGAEGDMIYVSVIPSEISNGIDEKTGEEISFKLFPNPTDGEIVNLLFDEKTIIAELKIYNMLGKRIYQDIKPIRQQLYKLDVSSFDNGVYFLEAKTTGQMVTSKFIISK